MNNRKTNRSVSYNKILSDFVYYFDSQIIGLITLLVMRGATNTEIAKAMNKDISYITKKYKKHIQKARGAKNDK